MRSFNKARLIDVADKNLNPNKKHAIGKDGRLKESKRLEPAENEPAAVLIDPVVVVEQQQDEDLSQPSVVLSAEVTDEATEQVVKKVAKKKFAPKAQKSS